MIFVFLQGPRVCAWEAFWELAQRCTRLGNFEKPLLGHADPSVGQRWLRGGQENKKHPQKMHFLCFSRVFIASNVSWCNLSVFTKYQDSFSFQRRLIVVFAALQVQSKFSLRGLNWKVELCYSEFYLSSRMIFVGGKKHKNPVVFINLQCKNLSF